MLDESNTMSFLNHNRSAEHDYYKLQNREKQLATVANLSGAEQRYVLGCPLAMARLPMPRRKRGE